MQDLWEFFVCDKLVFGPFYSLGVKFQRPFIRFTQTNETINLNFQIHVEQKQGVKM